MYCRNCINKHKWNDPGFCEEIDDSENAKEILDKYYKELRKTDCPYYEDKR